MNFYAARALFAGLRDRVFLDAACVSLLPDPAATALAQLAEQLRSCPARDASAHHIALDATAEQPRRQIARLIGARPDDVALVESTTHALQALAAAVPLRRGDKILVGETEFLGLAVPWIPRRQRDGIHLESVPHRDGRLLVDDFARALDARTRIVLLSSVQWSNGYRADLAAFGELCRSRDVVLIVDAIQHLGAFPLDVGQTPVDAVVCGGHKWLNAPVGRGFLYVAPRLLEKLQPDHWGYLNIAEPEQGWAEYFATPAIPAVRDYDFVRSARALELGGTANYPGNVALGASVALINEIGRDAIREHIFGLTETFMDRLRSLGAQVVSPPEPEARSGIVTFTLGEGPARDTACLQLLLGRHILISQRYTAGVGGLRVSLHFFNNREDVERLVSEVAASWRSAS